MDEIVKDYYLAHHGVKGQKWGVRNGPPYPLDANSHSTKRKRSESNTDVKSFIDSYKSQRVSKLGAAGDAEMMFAETVLTIAAVLGISKLKEKFWRKSRMKEIENNYQNRKIRSLTDAPRLSHKMSAEDSVKIVNPDYPSAGSTMNCTFCTTAMAMREKGYDVKAKTTMDGFNTNDLFKKLFNSPDVKMPRKTKPQDAMKILSDQGEGAYGNLRVLWKMGGGHSVFWKNENGRTRIYDGQSGEEITSSQAKTTQFFNRVNCTDLRYNRFDNHEPTEYTLAVVERIN